MRGGRTMLRTTCPNISVITNFGCRAKCWYCVWNSHKLQNMRHPTDWRKLQKFLWINKKKGKVSVSGGGDPLYEYKNRIEWWNKFFEITQDLDMSVDVHTREKFKNKNFWTKNINRCVFSSDTLKPDIKHLTYLSQLTKVRITHLVTKNTTFRLIEDYLRFQDEIKCQFSIKELVNYNDGGMYRKLLKQYPEIFHLDTGDYNVYYMPDNRVRKTFLL